MKRGYRRSETFSAKVRPNSGQRALSKGGRRDCAHRWAREFAGGQGLAASSTSCGIAESDASAANNCCAASLSHTTIEPEPLSVNSPIGTVTVVMSPRSAHASRPRSQRWSPSSTVTVSDCRSRHRVPAQRVEQHGRTGGAVHECRHELALVDHPIQIGPRRGAAADVAERGAAVELLAAGGQLDTRQRVADRLGGTHLSRRRRRRPGPRTRRSRSRRSGRCAVRSPARRSVPAAQAPPSENAALILSSP